MGFYFVAIWAHESKEPSIIWARNLFSRNRRDETRSCHKFPKRFSPHERVNFVCKYGSEVRNDVYSTTASTTAAASGAACTTAATAAVAASPVAPKNE